MWSRRASDDGDLAARRGPTAARYVAATTRSGTTAWSAGRSSSTPSTSIRDVPAPRTSAPIAFSSAARSPHLGLARRVLDHGRALGQRRRHEQVVGRGVARVLEHDPRRRRRRPSGDASPLDVRRGGLEGPRPSPRAPSRWKSIGRVAEVVAARQRHARRAAAGEQRPEHDDRGAHLLDELVGRLGYQLAAGGVVTATSSPPRADRPGAQSHAAPRPSCRRR